MRRSSATMSSSSRIERPRTTGKKSRYQPSSILTRDLLEKKVGASPALPLGLGSPQRFLGIENAAKRRHQVAFPHGAHVLEIKPYGDPLQLGRQCQRNLVVVN